MVWDALLVFGWIVYQLFVLFHRLRIVVEFSLRHICSWATGSCYLSNLVSIFNLINELHTVTLEIELVVRLSNERAHRRLFDTFLYALTSGSLLARWQTLPSSICLSYRVSNSEINRRMSLSLLSRSLSLMLLLRSSNYIIVRFMSGFFGKHPKCKAISLLNSA